MPKLQFQGHWWIVVQMRSGLAGDDVRVIETSFQKADVSGIGDSNITGLNLCTVAGVIQTTSGPIVGIFHQYAKYGHGKTIHSSNQMASPLLEWMSMRDPRI